MFEEFFRRYADAVASSNLTAIAGCYAEHVLVAGPEGSSGTYQNDAGLLTWLREAAQRSHQSGVASLTCRAVVADLVLSPVHTMAIVEWAARFEGADDYEVPFRVAYLIEELVSGPKILASVSEEEPRRPRWRIESARSRPVEVSRRLFEQLRAEEEAQAARAVEAAPPPPEEDGDEHHVLLTATPFHSFIAMNVFQERIRALPGARRACLPVLRWHAQPRR